MTFRIALPLAALALAAAAAALPTAQAVAAPAKNWLLTVTPTASGTYVIGNPKARAKVVEYLSYTCSHCAHFVNESGPLKTGYVMPGKANIEIRHAVRDPIDMAAALLARCDGPAKFLGHSEAIFAAQSEWLPKGVDFYENNQARLKDMAIGAALGEYARASGLSALMQKRGLAPARQNACLADAGAQAKLAEMANEAWKIRKIPGTPSFLLNGTLAADVRSWPQLKTALDAALKP